MAATKFSFFVNSTSDRGDFPRIIVVALFSFFSFYILSQEGEKPKLLTFSSFCNYHQQLDDILLSEELFHQYKFCLYRERKYKIHLNNMKYDYLKTSFTYF